MKRIYTYFHFLKLLLYNHYKIPLNESMNFKSNQHFCLNLYLTNNNLHLIQQIFLQLLLHLY